MPTIVYSTLDLAGKNIANHLVSEHNFEECEKILGFRAWRDQERIELIEIDKPLVTADFLDELKTDLIVFASKHRSVSGKPTLTAHPCGNWNEKAELGGKPRTLAPTSARAMASAIRKIRDERVKFPELAEFDVVLECTHHGPLLSIPFVFVEIGATEKEWANESAGRVAAEACVAACKSTTSSSDKIAIGLGGIHYPHEISKRVLNETIAVGHMCPKHAIEFLDETMLSQMIEKSGGKVGIALIDWKSLKAPEREKVLKMLKDFNVPFEKA